MKNFSFVVLDIETTGLSPKRHGITEIFAARVNFDGDIVDRFHSFVNPERLIPPFITRLTGITDEMVKDAPLASVAIRNLDDFISSEDVIVGHNIRFDLSFLNHHRSLVLGDCFPNVSLCTLLLARRIFSHNPLDSYKLANLAKFLDIDDVPTHRAEKDVLTTISLFSNFSSFLSNQGFSLPDVVLLQSLPLFKARERLSSFNS